MKNNDTPQDGPEPQPANGARTERRYARRIDCAERPRDPRHAAPADPPTPPRDDTPPRA